MALHTEGRYGFHQLPCIPSNVLTRTAVGGTLHEIVALVLCVFVVSVEERAGQGASRYNFEFYLVCVAFLRALRRSDAQRAWRPRAGAIVVQQWSSIENSRVFLRETVLVGLRPKCSGARAAAKNPRLQQFASLVGSNAKPARTCVGLGRVGSKDLTRCSQDPSYVLRLGAFVDVNVQMGIPCVWPRCHRQKSLRPSSRPHPVCRPCVVFLASFSSL